MVPPDAQRSDAVANYGLIQDLRAEVEVPRGGILSRTVFEDETLALTLFAFDTGQELTEHTSSRAAIIEVLDGEAELLLGTDRQRVTAGAWAAMPPLTPHAIRALTPLVMALTLLKPGA